MSFSSWRVSEKMDLNKELLVKIAYFTSLAGASIIFGFSVTLSKLRKDVPQTTEAKLYEEGATLARRALMRATLYSVCGFGAFAFASYQLFGKRMIANFNINKKKGDDKEVEELLKLFK